MARGSSTGRVSKRVASAAASSSSASGKSRMSARQQGKLAEQASGSGGALQDMVDELEAFGAAEPMEGVSFDNAVMLPKGDRVCPITDADEKPFPLMMLPPEIRNEIYRACLTRPFNILLSRREPPTPEPERGVDSLDVAQGSSDSDDESEDDDITEMPAQSQQSIQNIIPAMNLVSGSTQLGGSSPGQSQATGLRAWASRSTRPIRLLTNRSASLANNGNASTATTTGVVFRRSASRPIRSANRTTTKPDQPREARPQDEDPLLVNLLRTSKTVYQEARSILYSENLFTLDLDTALITLSALHQRSRRQIKHCELEIPSYNEILERFQECVRLSLRYCWGLKKFVINMPFTLPGADGSGTTGNTTVYANGFDILRWLPRQCQVELRGNVCQEIEAVVSKNANLAKTLDEETYAMRQLITGVKNKSEYASWRAGGGGGAVGCE
ncbi:hypothetical protein LTR36_005960 [Oleoguttula mirabilis]|uniref:DUF7730 domain-containing protein n=1 Tax=Oleoguttula mirabilis TaxID=1507867 RepID=A0AAV9JCS6_9PEZI|nr:hypothetical protein LTR36_005960 [Oleoguttula mirabilis]